MPNSKIKNPHFHIRMPPEVRKELDQIAHKAQLSRNRLILNLAEIAIQKEKDGTLTESDIRPKQIV